MGLTKRFYHWDNTVLRMTGTLLAWSAISMTLPLATSIYYGESVDAFLIPIIACVIISIPIMLLFRTSPEIRPVGGISIVAFAWILAAFIGSFPYIISGMDPLDAFFETMSGFTTTGASIMTDIESWPKGLLLWRSLTQWLGGAGIIMVFITIFPILGIGGRNLFRNEGPSLDIHNFSVRIREAAREFHVIYLVLSGLMIAALIMMGVGFYDALCISFSTISTGGFLPHSESMAYFSPGVQWLTIVFMLLGGTNFYLHYRVMYRKKVSYLKSTEFRWVMSTILIITGITVILRWNEMGVSVLGDVESLIRGSLFQVVSMATSSGFATEDYNFYPSPVIVLIFLAALVGGASGSTSGGIKTARIVITGKYFYNGLLKMIHPRAVMPVRYDTGPISEEGLNSILVVVMAFILVVTGSTIALSLLGMTPYESLSASITCISNVGPGVGSVGPYGSFADVGPWSKMVLIFVMWAGRLEVLTVLVMMTPVFWKEMARRRSR